MISLIKPLKNPLLTIPALIYRFVQTKRKGRTLFSIAVWHPSHTQQFMSAKIRSFFPPRKETARIILQGINYKTNGLPLRDHQRFGIGKRMGPQEKIVLTPAGAAQRILQIFSSLRLQ